MARPQRQWRLSIRHWRVRTKLAAVLLVPSLAFGAIGGVELASAVGASRTLQAYADRVALAREITALVHPLQRERDRLAGVLAEVHGAASDGARRRILPVTAPDRMDVDAAAVGYQAAVRTMTTQPDAAVTARITDADRELAGLTRLRVAAADGQLRNDVVFDGYSRLIAALLRVLPDSAGVGDDNEVGRRVRGLFDLLQAKELQSQVRGRLFATAKAKSFGLGEYSEFADLRARRTAAIDRFRAETDAPALARYEETVRGAAVVAAADLERSAAEGSRTRELSLDPDRWWTAATADLDLLRDAEREFVDAAIAISGRFQVAATGRARGMALWFALIVCTALAASYLVGRSTTQALRRLRGQALIVANHTLPDAIRRLSSAARAGPYPDIAPAATGASDEIGEVAEAFDAVHRSALRLAVEQATLRRDISAMFTNLARRSQLLVEGQLRLLDEMEAAEQDPDRLAQLFRLDHFTTRLRRNDENLLVLASAESRRLWREPAVLSKVLLGALAETEQYQRVRLIGPDDALVAGHVVQDLLHLLAELLDNATAFSPPSTMVEVGAVRAGEGIVVTICDSGMGMTRSMLAEANAKLAAPADIDVAFSERMGLFVVSHLAARHGTTVELSTAPRGGVRAVVRLPGTVFDRPGPVGGPAVGTSLGERLAGDPEPAADPQRALVLHVQNQHAVGPDAAPAGPPLPRWQPGAAPPSTPGADTPTVTVPSLREHRRGLPARVPLVDAAEVDAAADPPGGWWSPSSADGDGGWFGGSPQLSEPPAPLVGGVTRAGLPIRVPTANAPGRAQTTVPERPPVTAPAEIGTMLARFHNGVRRADDEEPAR